MYDLLTQNALAEPETLITTKTEAYLVTYVRPNVRSLHKVQLDQKPYVIIKSIYVKRMNDVNITLTKENHGQVGLQPL